MLMRKLGRSGLKVAALCLGGNTFGWTTDQAASETVLDAYVEAGGNFIDTADVYSRWAPGNKGGESETVLGAWMAARRNRQAVVVATKVCGPMGPGPNDTGLSRQHIMQAVEASLKRLQTDYIDLYQAHWDDRETPLDELACHELGVLRAGRGGENHEPSHGSPPRPFHWAPVKGTTDRRGWRTRGLSEKLAIALISLRVTTRGSRLTATRSTTTRRGLRLFGSA